jgi:hypothetical protein
MVIEAPWENDEFLNRKNTEPVAVKKESVKKAASDAVKKVASKKVAPEAVKKTTKKPIKPEIEKA